MAIDTVLGQKDTKGQHAAARLEKKEIEDEGNTHGSEGGNMRWRGCLGGGSMGRSIYGLRGSGLICEGILCLLGRHVKCGSVDLGLGWDVDRFAT